ncbi:MAG: folate-binding protein YgfZ [Puniceicoccaceae bacterium]
MSSTYYITQPAAVLRFTGEDHFDFLQGQGTADLRGQAGSCHYSLWLDFKGRILADSFLLRESDEAILLVSYGSASEQLLAKFERHIIADDVEIEDLTGQFQLLSFPDASTAGPFLSEHSLAVPAEGQFAMDGSARYCFHGRRLGRETIDLLVPGLETVDLASSMSDEAADSLRMRDAIPLIPEDCEVASANPLELNIMSALSFDKGCYLGQEVVARVHRLGRTTRRLVRIETAEEGTEPLPTKLILEDDQTVTLSSISELNGRQVGFAMVKRKVEDGPVTAGGQPLLIQSVGES